MYEYDEKVGDFSFVFFFPSLKVVIEGLTSLKIYEKKSWSVIRRKLKDLSLRNE